jgi:hypothetical protein
MTSKGEGKMLGKDLLMNRSENYKEI